ncbi:hypothetical protein [Colwellia sp. BRX8-9]|uniref:hypothetical protein n=1 Tax=Colwellia sp. BRX8-9 TaxID=2759831 RepID=UPI0015F56F50|nr:hypothetical protein [Colwellia sp. BRX8-9]MBA6349476.1 hypothetical protein [Colwellia sp. BRX8-9]
MIQDIISLSFATMLAKISPILIGLLLAMDGGENNYQLYVSFLMLSNLIISISAMGCSPQIISLEKNSDSNAKFINFVLIGAIGVLLSLFIIYQISVFYNFLGGIFLNISIWSIFLYSLGSCLIYLAATRFNNLMQVKWSAYTWASFCFCNFTCFAGWLLLSKEISVLFNWVAVLTFFCGSTSIVAAVRVENIPKVKECFLSKDYYFTTLKNAFYLSVFGFSTVGMFLYLQRLLVVNDENGSVYFSFLYQVFTIATFLPLILGNIVIPRIVMEGSIGKKVYVVYCLSAGLIMTVFLLLHSNIVQLYGIDSEAVTNYNTIIFSVVAVVACVNSYSIQMVVARKKFHLLVIYSIFWTGLILGYIHTNPLILKSVLEAMVISYSICSFILFILVLKRRYL